MLTYFVGSMFSWGLFMLHQAGNRVPSSALLVFLLLSFPTALQTIRAKWRLVAMPKRVTVFIFSIWSLWYAIPYLAFHLKADLIPEFFLFDENLFLQAGYLIAALLNGFATGWMFAQKVRTPLLTPLKKYENRISHVEEIVFVALSLGLLALAYNALPTFRIRDFAQYLDTFDPYYDVPSNRWMSISIVCLVFGSLAMYYYRMTGRNIYIILALLPIICTIYMGLQIGRRQIMLRAIGLYALPLLAMVKRPVLWVGPIFVVACIIATAGLAIRTANSSGESKISVVSVFESPVGELSATSAYHGRLLHYLDRHGFWNGKTYLESAHYAIPFYTKFVSVIGRSADPSGDTERYMFLVARETVEWAPLYTFSFGSSFLSECYANFGKLAAAVIIILGFGCGIIVKCFVAEFDTLLGHLVASILITCMIWGVRGSMGDLYNDSRYLFIASGYFLFVIGLRRLLDSGSSTARRA
jgi:hypothetical protein